MNLPTGRDRVLLLGCLGLAVALILLLAVFTPEEQEDFPTTYGTDTHGAKAAYLLLAQSGFHVERWTRPLPELIPSVDSHTVLILPSPDGAPPTTDTVRAVLDHGGRVLTAGLYGANILPDASAAPGGHGPAHDCQAEPDGFSPLNVSTGVHLRTTTRWTATGPRFHVDYTCEGLPVAVHYSVGKGQAIWWADALPLENAGITQGGNLALLLASIGSVAGARIVWDEAPPSEPASLWSYAEGTPVGLIGWQLALVVGLLLFSISRRSGPLRPDPVVSRAAPMEFVAAMGALYAKAHATNAAVTLAYRGFLDRLDRTIPVRQLEQTSGAAAVVEAIGARAPATLAADLATAEAARSGDPIPIGRALALVRRLHDHGHTLAAYTQANRPPSKERAS